MQIIRTSRAPWWLGLTAGILLIITALALLIWPFMSASWLLALLFGTTLVAAGLSTVFSTRAKTAIKVFGGVMIAAGLLAIVFNEVTASIMVAVFGATVITLSVLGLIVTLTMGGGTNPALLVPSVLGIIAGVIPLFWPEFALGIIAVMLGFFTLIWGVTVIVSSLNRRNASVYSYSGSGGEQGKPGFPRQGFSGQEGFYGRQSFAGRQNFDGQQGSSGQQSFNARQDFEGRKGFRANDDDPDIIIYPPNK